MTTWRPATIEEVKSYVNDDLAKCDHRQNAVFKQYGVEPFTARIRRFDTMESVVVVARNQDQVIYWEDIEEGFNISAISADGEILEPGFEQDELGWALNKWSAGAGSDRPKPN